MLKYLESSRNNLVKKRSAPSVSPNLVQQVPLSNKKDDMWRILWKYNQEEFSSGEDDDFTPVVYRKNKKIQK
jgi:hypothetical protein